MSSELVIRANKLSKHYQIYEQPHHRLLQMLWRGRKQFYRDFHALSNVSLELRRGETLGIIGRNGAGKSTLLQLICGVLTPSSGSVEVHGRIAALLELGTGFNPEFTGRENLAINAAILGLTGAEIEARTEDILAFADIGEFIDQPVKTYSSGMYIRLAFAVAIHVSPDILIVDEALAVGDVFFQAKCATRIKRMLDDGVTLLFISHDIAAVKALCAQVLWLERGHVRALGRTREIATQYSQDWVGETNAIRGADQPASIQQADGATGIIPGTVAVQGDVIAPERTRTGTGAARFTHVLWSTAEGRTDRMPVTYGSAMTIRLQLRIMQPCERLVVSYHIKDARNQHVMGSHTAAHEQLYNVGWLGNEEVSVNFRLPVLLHTGPYSLTILVASIADVEQYTDAVFLDWVEDVAVMTVAARARFPLSDLVEVDNEVEIRVAVPEEKTAPGHS